MVVVLEVGIGGTWIPRTLPTAWFRHPIGLDHTDMLGETLAEIARKSGIIKPGGF